MNVRNKKKIICLLLICLVSIAGVFAMLSATDSVTNTFTQGKVKIALYETVDGTVYDESVTSVTLKAIPTLEISKQPYVKNIGTTDAYVYLVVKIPVEDVVLLNNLNLPIDGETPSAHEMFSLTTTEDWSCIKKLTEEEYGESTDGFECYLYCYTKKLAPGETTTALCDSFTTINYDAPEELTQTTIPIKAYAVQADSDYATKQNIEDMAIADIWGYFWSKDRAHNWTDSSTVEYSVNIYINGVKEQEFSVKRGLCLGVILTSEIYEDLDDRFGEEGYLFFSSPTFEMSTMIDGEKPITSDMNIYVAKLVKYKVYDIKSPSSVLTSLDVVEGKTYDISELTSVLLDDDVWSYISASGYYNAKLYNDIGKTTEFNISSITSDTDIYLDMYNNFYDIKIMLGSDVLATYNCEEKTKLKDCDQFNEDAADMWHNQAYAKGYYDVKLYSDSALTNPVDIASIKILDITADKCYYAKPQNKIINISVKDGSTEILSFRTYANKSKDYAISKTDNTAFDFDAADASTITAYVASQNYASHTFHIIDGDVNKPVVWEDLSKDTDIFVDMSGYLYTVAFKYQDETICSETVVDGNTIPSSILSNIATYAYNHDYSDYGLYEDEGLLSEFNVSTTTISSNKTIYVKLWGAYWTVKYLCGTDEVHTVKIKNGETVGTYDEILDYAKDNSYTGYELYSDEELLVAYVASPITAATNIYVKLVGKILNINIYSASDTLIYSGTVNPGLKLSEVPDCDKINDLIRDYTEECGHSEYKLYTDSGFNNLYNDDVINSDIDLYIKTSGEIGELTVTIGSNSVKLKASNGAPLSAKNKKIIKALGNDAYPDGWEFCTDTEYNEDTYFAMEEDNVNTDTTYYIVSKNRVYNIALYASVGNFESDTPSPRDYINVSRYPEEKLSDHFSRQYIDSIICEMAGEDISDKTYGLYDAHNILGYSYNAITDFDTMTIKADKNLVIKEAKDSDGFTCLRMFYGTMDEVVFYFNTTGLTKLTDYMSAEDLEKAIYLAVSYSGYDEYELYYDDNGDYSDREFSFDDILSGSVNIRIKPITSSFKHSTILMFSDNYESMGNSDVTPSAGSNILCFSPIYSSWFVSDYFEHKWSTDVYSLDDLDTLYTEVKSYLLGLGYSENALLDMDYLWAEIQGCTPSGFESDTLINLLYCGSTYYYNLIYEQLNSPVVFYPSSKAFESTITIKDISTNKTMSFVTDGECYGYDIENWLKYYPQYADLNLIVAYDENFTKLVDLDDDADEFIKDTTLYLYPVKYVGYKTYHVYDKVTNAFVCDINTTKTSLNRNFCHDYFLSLAITGGYDDYKVCDANGVEVIEPRSDGAIGILPLSEVKILADGENLFIQYSGMDRKITYQTSDEVLFVEHVPDGLEYNYTNGYIFDKNNMLINHNYYNPPFNKYIYDKTGEAKYEFVSVPDALMNSSAITEDFIVELVMVVTPMYTVQECRENKGNKYGICQKSECTSENVLSSTVGYQNTGHIYKDINAATEITNADSYYPEQGEYFYSFYIVG